MAATLNNMAVVQRLSASIEALQLYDRALKINEATYGPQHSSVAATLYNMALVRDDLDEKRVEALQLYDRALKINEATYGPQHSSVAATLNNMASVRDDLGEQQECSSTIVRSRSTGDYGPPQFGGDDAEQHGGSAEDFGEHQEALQLYDRALKIKAYGPQHSSVGDTLYNMAVLRKSLGEMAEAKALYLRCEQIYAAVYGADHSRLSMPAKGCCLRLTVDFRVPMQNPDLSLSITTCQIPSPS